MGRVIQPFEFVEPSTIDEALGLAAAEGSRLFAGGCELVLSMRRGEVRYRRLVSIMGVGGLGGFRAHPKHGLEFGAQVKIRQLANHIWVGKRWAALHEAIEQLHPPHIMNMGTVVGNLCSAVPYYDLPTSLYAHRAVIRIGDGRSDRELPIDDFYIGPRMTALGRGEMVTSIFVPPPLADAGSAFKKIYKARRRSNDLHKINAAAYVALDADKETIVDATLVIGSVGAKPVRIAKAETVLRGQSAGHAAYEAAAEIAAKAVEPMTDAAWVEEIRSEWIRLLARDVLEQAASRARSRHDPAEDAHLAF
ncbi:MULTISPECIES: xanthine dehydrogenase family protein subunit M [unclassified Mesorhizobium]|uniref:FAD binding domain-containing protein n=1 Tax=unclassified Mesorhizobium TaxID=325217 RepID=UPI0015E45B63|nr:MULTISPECIES: FAD binding domain-containing protein [unclassified Mesorhizobium]